MLAMDTSRSMAFADGGATKLQVGTLLAAALTYLLVHQGEAVGLVTHGSDTGTALPARTGRPHLVRTLGLLSRVTAEGGTDLAGGIRRAAARLGRRGCVALISDLYGDDDLQPALREARRMGHEVVVFHVLTPGERSLSADGDVEFVDLETAERLVASTPAVRDDYAARVAAFIDDARAFAARRRHHVRRCPHRSADRRRAARLHAAARATGRWPAMTWAAPMGVGSGPGGAAADRRAPLVARPSRVPCCFPTLRFLRAASPVSRHAAARHGLAAPAPAPRDRHGHQRCGSWPHARLVVAAGRVARPPPPRGRGGCRRGGTGLRPRRRRAARRDLVHGVRSRSCVRTAR